MHYRAKPELKRQCSGRTLPASLIATTDDQALMISVSTRSRPQPQFIIRPWGLFAAYTYVIAVMPFIFIIIAV
jgi:hypothetical protein